MHARPPYTDPAVDPLTDPVLSERPMRTNGRGGLIAAGIIAVLLVIAVIAFSSGTVTDPGTTAVIPDQTEQTTPPPAGTPGTMPEQPQPLQPGTTPAPAE